MKIICWNVNGIRAIDRKGNLKDIWKLNPDVLCFQETKIAEDEIPFDLRYVPDYTSFFSSGKKKGYSGVGMYTKNNPDSVKYSFGDEKYDDEGRIIQAFFKNFTLFNIYFPNGKASEERLKYKMDFYNSFLNHMRKKLKKGEKIVICGDVNTAHKEIDIARPKQNENNSGFLPEERQWMDEFLEAGFIDSFREFNKEKDQYTYWDVKTRARERNVGWRIDYFFVSKNLRDNLKDSYILKDVLGSDHAPIVLELDF
jgi:exodeoxyribonuclease III